MYKIATILLAKNKRKHWNETCFAAPLYHIVLIVFSKQLGVPGATCVLHPGVQDQKGKWSLLPTCSRQQGPRIPQSSWKPAYQPWGPSVSNPIREPTGQHQKGIKNECVEHLIDWLHVLNMCFLFPYPDSLNIKTFSSEFVTFCMCLQSARQTEPIIMQADDDGHTFELPTPPRNGATGSKRTWEYNVPEISIVGVEDKQIPEMPNLESVLGNSLQSVRPKATGHTDCCIQKFTRLY